MSATTLKTASVLAFERKLDPSDALFTSGIWAQRNQADNWPPIVVREKSVRGTISNRLKSAKDADPAKLDAAIQNPNLQTVDVANLPGNADTLRVCFTLRVLAGLGVPSACNNTDYQAKLQATVQGYLATEGLSVLAARYATNLANGRFLWRNRLGAEQIEVRIAKIKDGEPLNSWTFDALAWSLREFNVPAGQESAAKALARVVENGLSGQEHVLLRVEAFVRLGDGQEVFPSQELILDKSQSRKSKTLYTVDGVAGMHSQKIGNALRSIDTWYPEATEQGPIAVEPYGSVTTQGKAYRQPSEKMDFYTLLDGWLIKDKTPTLEQKHFILATLIRGGVFGDAGKE